MRTKFRRLLSFAVVLCLVVTGLMVGPSSAVRANGAIGCTQPWWPTSGQLSTYHVSNSGYETSFSFTLTKEQRDNLRCVSAVLEIDFQLHGFLVPPEWDRYVIHGTNLPGAIHDVAASDINPFGATPAVTRIHTSQLEPNTVYYATLIWPNEPYPFGVQPIPGQQPSVSINWVPSYWADWNIDVAEKAVCEAFRKKGGDAWCIFPYRGSKDATVWLRDEVTGLPGGRLLFDGSRVKRFGSWVGSSYPSVPTLPMLGESFSFLPYLPVVNTSPHPLGADFNRDGIADIYAFNKRDAGSGKTVYFILDGRDPTRTLRVGATLFGHTDEHWSFAGGPDFNGDAIPDIYAFNKRDAGSGKTVYFVLNGNAPDQILQVGATPFGHTDANWSFGPGPDFNRDGKPDMYAFNRRDAGSGKTVYFVLNGRNPEHVLQVGATHFGWTDSNWSFSAGPDWNGDTTPDFYAFNKQDVGTGHTVYCVLDGRDPARQLQVGQLPFTWTTDDWSFAPLGDQNHDGKVDFHAFNRHDAGSGKTVRFVLNGQDPSQFLQIGATPFGWTDGNWSFGAGDIVRSNFATYVAFNRQDVGSGKTVFFKMDSRSPDTIRQVGATPFGHTDQNWSFAPGPDFNHDGTPDLYAFNKKDVGSGKTIHVILDGKSPDRVIQVGGSPFGHTDEHWSFAPGPDFNGDGKPDIYAFNKRDVGSGKTVHFVLDGTYPERVLQVGATHFGHTDANWSFWPGADWNRDGKPDIYAFNKRDQGSGKTVYFVLNGRNPEQVLQVGATAFGWTDENYTFMPGPDFNHDGTPDFYGFNRKDEGSGKTVFFIMNGKDPSQFLQIGATPFGHTDANWDLGVVGG